jgi:hypothetical protein
MPYRVLIVVKGEWYSDQKELGTFDAARRHQKDVAAKWSTSDTAILAPDGRVLNYQDIEMIALEKTFRAERREARGL